MHEHNDERRMARTSIETAVGVAVGQTAAGLAGVVHSPCVAIELPGQRAKKDAGVAFRHLDPSSFLLIIKVHRKATAGPIRQAEKTTSLARASNSDLRITGCIQADTAR